MFAEFDFVGELFLALSVIVATSVLCMCVCVFLYWLVAVRVRTMGVWGRWLVVEWKNDYQREEWSKGSPGGMNTSCVGDQRRMSVVKERERSKKEDKKSKQLVKKKKKK